MRIQLFSISPAGECRVVAVVMAKSCGSEAARLPRGVTAVNPSRGYNFDNARKKQR
jgi:hypothetical protein